MIKILNRDSAVLRAKARMIPPEEITSEKIRAVIARMKEALDSQDDGVAIAAPQIGESLQIVLVSRKVFREYRKESSISEENAQAKDMVLINPEIVKQSQKKSWMEEGCLSVRWLYGKTYRADKTTVRAYDENGAIFTYGGSGLLSQIFQHEIDHLHGILFIDHAKNLKEFEPPKKGAAGNE
ncbi:MAG TPA: peptide deformylase [Candidatus Paceibacterota bacterium]|nr:peptide deformylase [Candidatus Paceibacterota bacterium]